VNAIELYDTTLRDGSQTWGVTFSLEDKLRIAQKLDELGIDLIKAGIQDRIPRIAAFSALPTICIFDMPSW